MSFCLDGFVSLNREKHSKTITTTQQHKCLKEKKTEIFAVFLGVVIKPIIDLGVSRFSLIEKTVKKLNNKQDQS